MNWLSLPPLSALRAFAAFAETGSMSQAGQALNVSHAAISQQVRGLEDHLGLALVDRSARKLELTEEGRRLAETLALGFSAIGRTLEELTGADADRPLQVTTTPGFATTWLMPRIAGFRHRHPEIDMMLNPTPDIVALEVGGIDVAIRFGLGAWAGVAAEVLFKTSLVIVAAPSLVGDTIITAPEDLLDFPWLQELGTSESTDWLHRHGVESGRVRGLVQMPGNLVLEGVRNGQGVVVTAMSSVEGDVRSGRLRVLFEDTDDTGYHIVTRPGVLRPPAKAFVGWLRQQAKTLRHPIPSQSGGS